MGRNDNDDQDNQSHQVFDLQDTLSDYFEKSHDFSECEQRDNGSADSERE